MMILYLPVASARLVAMATALAPRGRRRGGRAPPWRGAWRERSRRRPPSSGGCWGARRGTTTCVSACAWPLPRLPSLPVPPALPSNRPSALLPRRELPDGGARPNAAQLKQLVVAALKELHGEVRGDREGTGRGGWCWGKVLPLLPVLLGLCLCPTAPGCPALEVGTGRVVSGGAAWGGVGEGHKVGGGVLSTLTILFLWLLGGFRKGRRCLGPAPVLWNPTGFCQSGAAGSKGWCSWNSCGIWA